jgi:hypothetical protein
MNKPNVTHHSPARNGVITTEEAHKQIRQPADRGLEQSVLCTPLLGQPLPGSRVAELRTNRVHDLWIVGDLHGDLTSMVNIWHYARTESLRSGLLPHMLFLGDIIDRGTFSAECLQYLFLLIVQNPGAIGLIPGNHDVALAYDHQQGFHSRVHPAEYSESLQNRGVLRQRLRDDPYVVTAHTAIKLIQRCPAAIITSDGTLFTHAGMPHVDLHEQIRSFDDLSAPACVEDFTWLRLNTTVDKKRPNRHRLGCEFGAHDFDQFCHLSERLSTPVHRMVRGHDHVPMRYSVHSSLTSDGILTLNSMGQWLPDEQAAGPPARPCIGRFVGGSLPEIHQVPMPIAAEQSAAYAYWPKPEFGRGRSGAVVDEREPFDA